MGMQFLRASLGRLALTGAMAAAGLLAAGAARAADAPGPADTDAQFFGELGYKDVATAADAARALAIFVSEGTESDADFDAARDYLRSKGILTGWLEKARPDDSLAKGQLASLVCRALGIKGGLWMRLFGPLPRLALRECVYLDLMVRGAEYQHVTGGELVGVIDRADRFRLAQAGKEVPIVEGRPSGTAEEQK